MTREAFEQAYAERCGVTVEQLHTGGMHAEPCNCGGETCQGWAMRHRLEDRLRP